MLGGSGRHFRFLIVSQWFVSAAQGCSTKVNTLRLVSSAGLTSLIYRLAVFKAGLKKATPAPVLRTKNVQKHRHVKGKRPSNRTNMRLSPSQHLIAELPPACAPAGYIQTAAINTEGLPTLPRLTAPACSSARPNTPRAPLPPCN